MAKGIRLGVGGIKTSKKVWVGVNGVARKVKKIFGGVSNFARLMYSAGITKISVSPLGTARVGVCPTANSDYAIMSGGAVTNVYNSYLDAYDTSLVRTSPNNGHNARTSEGVATPNYAFVFGGHFSSGGTKSVYVFNTNLIRQAISDMSGARQYPVGVYHGEYALIAGGGYASVEAFNVTTLVKHSQSFGGSAGIYDSAFATVGNYAIYAGGKNGSEQIVQYTLTLTKELAFASAILLSVPRFRFGSASVGSYALFAGGQNNSGLLDSVDAFNSDLVRTSAPALSQKKGFSEGISLDGVALFVGGWLFDSPYASNVVETYDENLVRTTIENLGVTNREPVGISFNNYALILQDYSYNSDLVESYEI